jgi:hypothetical protein
MNPRYHRYKDHRFSITSKPVHDAEGCTFFADIYWVERDQEEFTRFICDRNFMTPQEARMEGIAIVRNWIDDGKPAVSHCSEQVTTNVLMASLEYSVNTVHEAMFKWQSACHQLSSALEQSYRTIKRSRVLHAELEQVLEQSRLALLASERQRNG